MFPPSHHTPEPCSPEAVCHVPQGMCGMRWRFVSIRACPPCTQRPDGSGRVVCLQGAVSACASHSPARAARIRSRSHYPRSRLFLTALFENNPPDLCRHMVWGVGIRAQVPYLQPQCGVARRTQLSRVSARGVTGVHFSPHNEMSASLPNGCRCSTVGAAGRRVPLGDMAVWFAAVTVPALLTSVPRARIHCHAAHRHGLLPVLACAVIATSRRHRSPRVCGAASRFPHAIA